MLPFVVTLDLLQRIFGTTMEGVVARRRGASSLDVFCSWMFCDVLALLVLPDYGYGEQQ
jgi:hypothetical protein